MHPTTLLLALSAALTTASPLVSSRVTPSPGKIPEPDAYEAIHQAQYRLAKTLDRKAYGDLHYSMTSDIVYDNSQFLSQGRPGGVAKGLDQVIASTKAAFGDALVEHIVSTDKIEFLTPSKAHVLTYIIYSHWDAKALRDDSKTFRIFEQCDDYWILQGGLWKLQTSKVVNMGPNWELPDVRIPKTSQQ